MCGYWDYRVALPILAAVASIGWTSFVYLAQKRQRRSQLAWEEYKETVYDPILFAIHDLEQIARKLRPSQAESNAGGSTITLLRQLGEALNDMEMACEKADQHDNSAEDDWLTQAEQRAEKIHNTVPKTLSPQDPSEVNGNLSDLYEEVQSYRRFFVRRLRMQREAMLNY